MSKNSKYQTHKKSIKLTKNPNDQTGAPRASGALKGGTLSRFLTSIVAEHQKIGGGTLWEIFFEKKSHNAEKTERGDPLVSPGIVCYTEKKENFLVQFAKPNDSIRAHKIS